MFDQKNAKNSQRLSSIKIGSSKRRRRLIIVSLLLTAAFTFAIGFNRVTKIKAQDQDDGSRQIVLEEFTRARPPRVLPRVNVRTGGRRAGVNIKPPRYTRKSAAVLKSLRNPASEIAELGLTIWRLRPSREADPGARMLIMDGGQSTPWTPERIEADQLLNLGDRVRMSVESPKAGFLYVIDREQYTDGSLGDPMLIFPTLRTRGGNNQVKPGMLIDIPGQDDSPPYFTLASNNQGYVGELLTIIVATTPIQGLNIGRAPLSLSMKELQRWQKLWSTEAERFEMDGGAGTVWTAAEKAAALANSGRTLTQDEPSPQTVYKVAVKTASGFLVNVPLRRR
jgi:hypothetical protein